MKKNKKPAVSVPYEDFLMKRLKSPRACVGYLNAALEEGDEKAFLVALNDVAQAQGGISKVSRLTNIHRVSLHRMLSKHGNPEMASLSSILHALGLKLAVLPYHSLKKAA